MRLIYGANVYVHNSNRLQPAL